MRSGSTVAVDCSTPDAAGRRAALAHLFEEVVASIPSGMIAERTLASEPPVTNARFVQDEPRQLPAGLGTFAS
jgi:hypothetical protein